MGSAITGLPFKIPHFEWDGVNYPQGPPECKFGSNFELKILERYNFDYIQSKVPRSLRGIEWQPISVQGDGLDLYVAQIFGMGKGEEEGYTFKDLLFTLLSPNLSG
ncbi:hypothetical protein [Paraflavitalea speifideaquila]|uniref:hypothetical protein n=1 Tax=Paraflavitalea speifideaquila TaxID=3076558 RepID=UPI0028E79128|nr:hypothetical protein [Paraflavitalea speifideiaquila]